MLKFIRSENGVSAMEFALVSPLMCLMFLGIESSWNYMKQTNTMRDTVEAVAKYYLQGGSNDTQAASIGSTAWTNKPSDGTLGITRSYICGTTVVTTVNCSNGTVPTVELAVQASASWTDTTSSMIFPNGLSIVQSETIRVR